jgi:hypothetical protein
MTEKATKCEVSAVITMPKPAKFERRLSVPASEASLVQAIRAKKRQDPATAAKIDEILRKAAKDIEAL